MIFSFDLILTDISNMAVIASLITPDHIYMFLQLSKR